jgi:hypothetical protein
MRSVLGIDAAWTCTQPSGVALAEETAAGWDLIAVAPSYQCFHALAGDDLVREVRPSGSIPDATALLASCRARLGRPVDLVAIDMPLSHEPINGRRVSDNAISKEYRSAQMSHSLTNRVTAGPDERRSEGESRASRLPVANHRNLCARFDRGLSSPRTRATCPCSRASSI